MRSQLTKTSYSLFQVNEVDSLGHNMGLPIKKTSHRRGAQLCAPTNVQIIWNNLFFGSPYIVPLRLSVPHHIYGVEELLVATASFNTNSGCGVSSSSGKP